MSQMTRSAGRRCRSSPGDGSQGARRAFPGSRHRPRPTGSSPHAGVPPCQAPEQAFASVLRLMDGEDDVLLCEQQELERGLELIDDGAYFEAHEVIEDRGPVAGRGARLPGPRPRGGGLAPRAAATGRGSSASSPRRRGASSRMRADPSRRRHRRPPHPDRERFLRDARARDQPQRLDANAEELEHTVEPDVQPPKRSKRKQPEGDEQRAAHDPEHRVLIA